MENAYFYFSDNARVSSNVLQEGDVAYSLDGSKLRMESAQPLELDVTYMQHDSMILEGNYSLYYIKLFLTKEK